MIAPFMGGPFDGLELDHNQINAHCEMVPIPTEAGVRLFVLMPPLSDWDRLVAGVVSKEGVTGKFHPYERVFAGSRVEFHDAAVNGAFQQAVDVGQG